MLAGIEPIGIRATDDVDALLALKPDCVSYMPFRPDFDHVVRILESGINLVTTMYMLAGRGYGDDVHERIKDAAARGQSSLYASGIYPGHANMVALAASAMCTRIDCISVLESLDMSGYANEQMFRAMGIDRALDDPEAPALVEGACGSFKEQIRVMARALEVELDEIRFEAEFGAANRTTDFGFMTIQEGRIAGFKGVLSGVVDGRPRPVQVRVEGRPRHDAELARRRRLRHRDRGGAGRTVPARADRSPLRRRDHHRHAGGERDPAGVRGAPRHRQPHGPSLREGRAPPHADHVSEKLAPMKRSPRRSVTRCEEMFVTPVL